LKKPSDSQEQQSEDSVDQSEKQDGADSAADSDTSATDTPSGEEAELPVEETSEGSSSDENMKIEL